MKANIISLILLIVCASTFATLGNIRGFVITSDYDNLNETAIEILKQVQEDLQITSIQVNLHVKQDNISSSVVYRYHKTASNESFLYFLESANSMGIPVFMKVLVTTGDMENGWMYVNPENPELWFQTYEYLLFEFIELGKQAGGLAGISIGTELYTLSKQYPSNWNALIQDIRGVYDGSLSYAALITEIKTIPFWNLLDVIGIDAYLPLNRTVGDVSPSVEDMTTLALFYYNRIYAWQQESGYGNIPIYFTETGFSSYTGVAASPWLDPDDSCDGFVSNSTAQQYAYEALFGAIQNSKLGVEGIFLFHLDLPSNSDYYGPPSNPVWACGFSPRGKPAYEVIQQAFRQ